MKLCVDNIWQKMLIRCKNRWRKRPKRSVKLSSTTSGRSSWLKMNSPSNKSSSNSQKLLFSEEAKRKREAKRRRRDDQNS